MNEFFITCMGSEDIQAVAEMEAQVFSDAWSKAAFEEELISPLSTLYVAKHGAELAGYLVLRCVYDEGEIINVAVSPRFRRCGCGKLLMQSALEQAKKEGLSVLMLEVRRSNLAAIHLYESFGLSTVVVRERYYENPTEDALLMTRFLQVGDEKIRRY